MSQIEENWPEEIATLSPDTERLIAFCAKLAADAKRAVELQKTARYWHDRALSNQERIAELETERDALRRTLLVAEAGIQNIASQARLSLSHVGIAEHQKKWILNEVSNEERIALAQFQKAIDSEESFQ